MRIVTGMKDRGKAQFTNRMSDLRQSGNSVAIRLLIRGSFIFGSGGAYVLRVNNIE